MASAVRAPAEQWAVSWIGGQGVCRLLLSSQTNPADYVECVLTTVELWAMWSAAGFAPARSDGFSLPIMPTPGLPDLAESEDWPDLGDGRLIV